MKNDKIIVTINDDPILKEEFIEELRALSQRVSTHHALQKNEKNTLKKQLLSEMIAVKMILQEAAKRNIDISEEKVQKKIQNILEQYSQQRLQVVLKKNNINFQTWQNKIKKQMIIDSLIQETIDSQITITEEEIKTYYNLFPEFFIRPEQVHALQIVVETESEARKILKKISKKGKNFSDLAKTTSIGPEGAKGGDLGFFSKGQMPEQFDIVFSLTKNQVSDIVKTPYGYHIFMIVEKRNKKQDSLKETNTRIKRILFKKKKETLFKEFINGLKDQSEITFS